MTPTATPQASVIVESVPVSALRESPFNRRQHTDPKTLEELTDSIRKHGVLTPLLVRPVDGKTGWEIVAGHRRWTAARRAKLETVPAQIRTLSDEVALEILVIENLQREDVHPLDEAEGYQLLIQRNKLTPEQLAAKVGKSTSYVYGRLKLVDLIPEVKKAFLSDALQLGHAILLARLQPADQKRALEEDEEYRWPRSAGPKHMGPVSDLREWIRENIELDLSKVPWDQADMTLVKVAGPCTTCPKRIGADLPLFPGEKTKAHCADGACFRQKLNAWYQRTQHELEAKGQTVVQLSTAYDSRRLEKGDFKKALTERQWRPAGAKVCPSTATGVVVDDGYAHGEQRHVGEVLRVCTNASCKVHRSDSASSTAIAQGRRTPSAESKREKARKRVMERRRRIVDALLKKTPSLDVQDLRFIAAAHWHELWDEHRKEIARRRGWMQGNAMGYLRESAIAKKHILPMDRATVEVLLLELAVVRLVHVSPYDGGSAADGRQLELIAKRHKVDVRAIDRELAAAEKAKKVKKTGSGPARPRKKVKTRPKG